MTLADSYMHILLNLPHLPYTELLPSTSSNPILLQLLSHSPTYQPPTPTLSSLILLSRSLTSLQIIYLFSLLQTEPTQYLQIINCLSKSSLPLVRTHFQQLFLSNRINQKKILLILMAKQYQQGGKIESSDRFWEIVNKEIANELMIPILQKLVVGKTQQKLEIARIMGYVKGLRGDCYEMIEKIDIVKLVEIKHSRFNSNQVLIGIVDIILTLQNKIIQHKVANKILQEINTNKKWVEIIQVERLIRIIQLVVGQNKEKGIGIGMGEKLVLEMVEGKMISVENDFKMFVSSQPLTMILLNLLKNTPTLLPSTLLSQLFSHLLLSQPYSQLFLTIFSPLLFTQLSPTLSLTLISFIPKSLIQFSSSLISIPQHIMQQQKLSHNQSLYSIYYQKDVKQYQNIVNFQIKEINKQSYVGRQEIYQVVKHVEYLLDGDRDARVELEGGVLGLVEELLRGRVNGIDTEGIYENVGRQGKGQQLLKRHYMCLQSLSEQEKNVTSHMIQILVHCKTIELIKVQTFINSISPESLAPSELLSIFLAHLNYPLSHSPYLCPPLLLSLKSTNILTDLISLYPTINPSHLPLSNLTPSPKFVQYLSNTQPSLLASLSLSTWSYYKQSLKNQFFRLYEQSLLPQVYPVNFRGSLFNDTPLVFEYLTPHNEQQYFSNYSAFMSLLYLEISCESEKTKGKKRQLIRYLFEKVIGTNKMESRLNTEYYTNLIWWKLFVLACYKLLDSTNQQQITYIVQFLLKDIENKNLPVLRQYMQLLFYKLLCLSPLTILPLLLSKLHHESSVNVNAPVILSLGLYMLDTSSSQIFQTLLTYIASHTAYVRALAQFYCFQYLKRNKNSIQIQPFLMNIAEHMEGSKENKKLMRNIREGVELFEELVKGMSVKGLFTVGFEKGEDHVVGEGTWKALEREGREYLRGICKYVDEGLREIVIRRIREMESVQGSKQVSEPSFDQYLSLHHRLHQLIIVATLLQKTPNFAHLVRTCSSSPHITLCFPSRTILSHPDYTTLLPQSSPSPLCSIIQLKQKDLLKYLTVQKQRGYQLIALEQTSNSVMVQKFEFPKKAVFVLGNQRVGMGSGVIGEMDWLVEIKQFGKVRSLNVHVSACVMLWEEGKGRIGGE